VTLTFVACPYCNASMPMPDPVPASRKVSCVRCGESFPVQVHESATIVDSPNRPAPPAPVKRRNRRIGLLVVGVMAVVFVGVLIYAIYSRGQRGTRTLAESPALGYLPDDTNVIAAVNVEEADAVRKTRKATGEPDVVDRLFFAESAAINVERLTGLRRDEIEEVLLGLKVDANLIPKVRLIVRTRSTYDAEALRTKLGSFRTKQEGAKTLDSIRPPGIPIEAVLWCATAKTFVITLTPEDMDKVPDQPSKDVNRLAPQLVDLMRYRGEKGTFFWLMGHSDNWEKTTIGFLSKTSKKLTDEERKKLFKMHTFALGMRMETGAVPSRARPARITEQVDPDARGYAADLVLNSESDEDAIALRSLVEGWLKNQRLELRDSTLKGPLYAASIAGDPDDWDSALKSVRDVLQLR